MVKQAVDKPSAKRNTRNRNTSADFGSLIKNREINSCRVLRSCSVFIIFCRSRAKEIIKHELHRDIKTGLKLMDIHTLLSARVLFAVIAISDI